MILLQHSTRSGHALCQPGPPLGAASVCCLVVRLPPLPRPAFRSPHWQGVCGMPHRPAAALNPGGLNEDEQQEAVGVDLESGQGALVVGRGHLTKARAMLTFMAPAAAGALADPLMTFTDTVSIGQFSGTLELAAMGPALVVFSFCQFVFRALQVTQLSLVSARLREEDTASASRMLTCGICVALVCGVASTLVLQVGGSALVQATGVQDVARVLPLSVEYVRIRSWAQPAVLLSLVCQAGLLAQQDAVTPMRAVLCSVVVSALGNVVFVAWLGWGLVGAALTTAGTQCVCAGTLLLALLGARKARPSRRMPLAADVRMFLTTLGPLTVSYLCKNLCYVMINTTAAGLATLQVAAHQAVQSSWSLLAFALGPVEMAALAFVPAAKTSHERRATVQVVLAMGAVIGLGSGLLVGLLLTLMPHALTRDASLWPSMASVALPACLSLVVVGVDVAATGINVALGDSAHLARSYALTFAVVLVCVAACRTWGWGLIGVWSCILGFFGLRALQSYGRVLLVHLGEPEALREAR